MRCPRCHSDCVAQPDARLQCGACGLVWFASNGLSTVLARVSVVEPTMSTAPVIVTINGAPHKIIATSANKATGPQGVVNLCVEPACATCFAGTPERDSKSCRTCNRRRE